jgi:hypothetical protein
LEEKNVTTFNRDAQFQTIFENVTGPNLPIVIKALTAFYACLIAVTGMGMVAALLMLICNAYKCRYVLYIVCTIFVVVGLSLFCATIAVSTAIPLTYFACDFSRFAFSNSSNFNCNSMVI